jgi:hypothetical protein
VKLAKLNEFRAGLLELKKADLTAKTIYQYWESNRDKLQPAGIVDNLGRYILSVQGINDIDALDGARDEIVGMVDIALASLGGANVRPFLEATILKTKDVKLSTLLREFNAIKNPYPNSAAIVLRTIICLIIQERAKLTKPDSELAKMQDLALKPMVRGAIETKIFDDGETKLLKAFEQQGLKETFDNVAHKPGAASLIKAEDLSALAQNTVEKLLVALV